MNRRNYGQWHRRMILVGILLAMLFLAGCMNQEKTPPKKTTVAATKEPATTMGIVAEIDTEGGKICFHRVEDGEKVAYLYTGATYFYSASKKAITAEQLHPGDVVDVEYLPEDNRITKMSITRNKDVWHNTKVTNFLVDTNQGDFRIGSTKYSFDEKLVVFSQGSPMNVQELNPNTDELQIWGKGTHILSVVVEKGHGYLELRNEDLFLGGMVNIGNTLIRRIEDNMLLTVQEGTYLVKAEQGSYACAKEATIERGHKTVLDYKDVAPDITATGNVEFTIQPDTATLLLNGKTYNHQDVITVPIGIYTVEVTAEGYRPFVGSITVKPGYQDKIIDLTAKEDVTQSDESLPEEESGQPQTTKEDMTTSPQETTSPNQTEISGETTTQKETVALTLPNDSGTVVSEKNKVTIAKPEGAEIYFDGTYQGKAPVTFAMVTGNHIVTVVEGESVRSYSVNLAEGGDDVKYDFSR